MKSIIREYLLSLIFKRISYIFLALFIFNFFTFNKSYTISSSISPTPQGKSSTSDTLSAVFGLGSSSGYFDFTDVISSNYVLQKFLLSSWINFEDNLQEMNVFTHYNIDQDQELDSSDRNRIAVDKIRKDLLVTTSRTTGLVLVEIISNDPNYGKKLLSFIQNESVNYINKIESNMSSQKINFLSKRVFQIEEDLKKAEYDLQLFLENNQNYSSPELQIEYLNKQRTIEITSSLLSTVVVQLEVAKIENLDNLPAVVILDEPYVREVSKLSDSLLNVIFVYILLNLFVIMYRFYIRSTSNDS